MNQSGEKKNIKRSLIDYEVYDINPEPVTDMEWVYKSANEKKLSATLETGKVVNLTIPEKSSFFLVDKSNFVKVISTDLMLWAKELSYSGYRILMYILSNIGVNDDMIRISISELRSIYAWKSNTMIYQGLENLLSCRFIFRSSESNMIYFVNRNKIYNGNRVVEAKKDMDNRGAYGRIGVELPKFDEIIKAKKSYSKAIKNATNR
jgi:hypothetical protein